MNINEADIERIIQSVLTGVEAAMIDVDLNHKQALERTNQADWR